MSQTWLHMSTFISGNDQDSVAELVLYRQYRSREKELVVHSHPTQSNGTMFPEKKNLRGKDDMIRIANLGLVL